MSVEKFKNSLSPLKLKAVAVSLFRRHYMNHIEIAKYREGNMRSRENDAQLNIARKKANNFNGEKASNALGTTPFEVYKWSHVLNTKNERLISDVIKEEKKNKKVKEGFLALIVIHKIVNRYGIVINDNEKDMMVENDINNYFYNLVNSVEYHLDRNQLIGNFLKKVKQNESLLFYYLYSKCKFFHALPIKCFWHYENIGDLHTINNCNNDDEKVEEYENEYLFSNVNLNKIDILLREEDTLSDSLNKKNDHMQKHTSEGVLGGEECDIKRKKDEVGYGLGNRAEGYTKNYSVKYDISAEETKEEQHFSSLVSDVNNEYSEGSKITPMDKKKSLSDKKDRTNGEYFTTSSKHKTGKRFFFVKERRHVSSATSTNNPNATRREIPNECRENIHSEQVTGCCDSRDDTTRAHVNESVIEEEGKTNFENLVEEESFRNSMNILDGKTERGEERNRKREILRVSKVPVSPLSRATVFGKVFFNIAKNSSVEYIKNLLTNKKKNMDNKKDIILNEKNAEILANGLSKMRGVVLKLGQMISLQDEYISPILVKALKLVNNSADIMPKDQLIHVLKRELGNDYEKKFDFIDYKPFASASIGQVHKAVINKNKVAVKVQYPGIYESIDSDIKNVLFINEYTNLLVKNLYIENLCREIKKELKCECDYINEAKYYVLFKNIFQNSKYFYVPTVYSKYVTKHILVTSYIEGITIDHVAQKYSQSIRDSIGKRIIYLCLYELFVLKIMNTDPNLGNFLYNVQDDKLCLIDFGATRSYKNEFVDKYLRLVKSSIDEDESKIYHYSYMLNFFTGKENDDMKKSHIKSVILVGEPFKSNLYDFGKNDLAKQIYKLLPKIIYNRLTPPRSEIYTLHRKLSGSYLICMKLKARVNAAHIFNSIYNNYKFSSEDTYLKGR
ncbi:ABC1 family, putative [Plasmodium ovale wallikeri]|uniref:ABC1 family, putative n=2 Tax=Plasmodium ovale TaxID=36330 RepID=A0A1A8ZXY3_PLAOA|nr:ABC1 family, putative [Plasmodium ovale wallikeri]SBT48790.1 ABC1 family, putative [Plasmodium ovale wallikeri]SBT82452.1 ABC1 family, putative [Plasmodium ovale]